jgi:dimeric dUTPase (all-alpha-NTP-PPase superfamily)
VRGSTSAVSRLYLQMSRQGAISISGVARIHRRPLFLSSWYAVDNVFLLLAIRGLASSRAVPHVLGMDKLEEIFQMQDALNQRIGVSLPPTTDEEKTKWILNYTRAMQQETAELIDSVPWKWWAKYQKFDEQNAKVEVVDLFHFLVSLAQTLGMTADDVYQAYLKKNAVNHQRQESGYVKKDESDSKHI